jgi:DNA topoisomerase-3
MRLIFFSTPTRVAYEGELPGDTWRLYDFIARTFIGSISAGLKYTTTNVIFAIGAEEFECKGTKVTSPGFSSVMHWYINL